VQESISCNHCSALHAKIKKIDIRKKAVAKILLDKNTIEFFLTFAAINRDIGINGNQKKIITTNKIDDLFYSNFRFFFF